MELSGQLLNLAGKDPQQPKNRRLGGIHSRPRTSSKPAFILSLFTSVIKQIKKVKQSHYRPGEALRVPGG
jgi:hypothetical protein